MSLRAESRSHDLVTSILIPGEQTNANPPVNFERVKLYHVYLLLCSDGTYYTGVTNDVERRISQHRSAEDRDAYTASRLPVELVYVQTFQWVQNAIEWEKRLKKWSSRKKKALTEENWDEVRLLAKCRNATSHTLRVKEPGTDKEEQVDR